MPLEYSESKTIFSLDDGTAQCQVDPKGAEVIYFEARTWRKNDHRYVEEYLPVGKPIYVIGQLDKRRDILDEDAMKKKLTEKLIDWKANKQQLLNRFNQSRDGQINMNEWEQARHEARKEVMAAQAIQVNNNSGFTLTKPAGQLFLISAKSPQQLRASYENGFQFSWAYWLYC